MRPRAVSDILRDAFPYAVFVLLLVVSWNRWIEPYVDTGRELMIPWRIAQGEALYRDVHFHHGPLGPYLAAGIDACFGPTLLGRELLAALLALLQVEGLRRVSLGFLAAGRASLATGLAVAVAVFLRPGGWLFPFSFDTALAVAAITWALALFREDGAAGTDRWVCLCLLAALLSRLELGLAAVAAVGLEARRQPRRLRTLALGPVGIAGVVYFFFSIGVPSERLLADSWLRLLQPPVAFQNVYRAYAGLDQPGLRAAELALAATLLLILASFILVAAMVAEQTRRKSPGRARLVEALAMLLLAAVALTRLSPPASLAQTVPLLPPLVRVVPIVVIAAALARLWEVLRGRVPAGLWASVPTRALLVAAAFAARLLLAAGYVGPYDAFFLPLPTVVAAAGLWRGAEKASKTVGASLARLTTGALLVFLLFRVASVAKTYRQPGWNLVSTAAGSLRLREPVASATRLALDDLDRRLPREGTLTGFPEAGFFNYVLRRKNPLPLEQFFPGHLDGAGEQRVLHSLAIRPPDAVVFIDVLSVGEGARVFGIDYFAALDRFLQQRFTVASAFGPGARPGAHIGDPDFFIEIRVPSRTPGPAGAR